jgi:hypothetical protein
MLVNPELRARFRRQAELLYKARVFGDAETIEIQTAGLCRAWLALDKAADAAGIALLVPDRTELPNDQGLPPIDWDTGDNIDDLFPVAAGRAESEA